jgi:putative flippase GtrA
MSVAAVRGPTPSALITQLVRFAVVGASNTIITLITYALLVAVGVPSVGAAVLSWSAGAANGYRLNRAWTFASAVRGARPAIRYVAVQAVGAGIDATAIWALVVDEHAPRIAGELVALPIATAVTFVCCRRWVFGADARRAA